MSRWRRWSRQPDTLRAAVCRAAIFFVLTLAGMRLVVGEWAPGYAAVGPVIWLVCDCARLWSNRPVGQGRALSNSRGSR